MPYLTFNLVHLGQSSGTNLKFKLSEVKGGGAMITVTDGNKSALVPTTAASLMELKTLLASGASYEINAKKATGGSWTLKVVY
ncbi:hypothetical protein EC957_000846 [Mortierella hygrophila]|uniref:Uncharacterized protein n=1 Tax=Mortierella hygrophila TaxID=979708 RepID=A0A9P6F6C3_9FUNG|nr:hypothetical protein EC957_000846 [Mortierella hygrophila]